VNTEQCNIHHFIRTHSTDTCAESVYSSFLFWQVQLINLNSIALRNYTPQLSILFTVHTNAIVIIADLIGGGANIDACPEWQTPSHRRCPKPHHWRRHHSSTTVFHVLQIWQTTDVRYVAETCPILHSWLERGMAIWCPDEQLDEIRHTLRQNYTVSHAWWAEALFGWNVKNSWTTAWMADRKGCLGTSR